MTQNVMVMTANGFEQRKEASVSTSMTSCEIITLTERCQFMLFHNAPVAKDNGKGKSPVCFSFTAQAVPVSSPSSRIVQVEHFLPTSTISPKKRDRSGHLTSSLPAKRFRHGESNPGLPRDRRGY